MRIGPTKSSKGLGSEKKKLGGKSVGAEAARKRRRVGKNEIDRVKVGSVQTLTKIGTAKEGAD